MPHADFVHLRVHSAYSLSEGAIKADKIPALALEANMPAVAITDTANLFGALEFSQACAAKGIQPIIGCQIALARIDNPRLPPDPIVLLAQDAAGLDNLQRLSSSGFLETDPGLKPQLSLDAIARHAAGLFLLTGGATGPLARLLAEGQKPEAERLLARFAEAFPDRVAMELHRHGLDRERALEPGLIALADAAGLPLVATNDCYFASPDMHEAHDALLAIAEGRLLSERDRRRVTPEHWFKPAPDMRVLFADLPEACDNTLAIARRCAVMMETRKPLLPVSPKVHAGSTEEETVRAMAIEGLDRRMDAMAADAGTRARYRERLDYELSVIVSMGFAGYFLIVADFIQWAKAQGIPVGPGRGSGAGSVAAWALTITDLDPIRFDLLFERFLNPERVSMPDFDIDFCQEGRDAVIDYVRREYGGDRVAQIITFGKLQARAAVRDVGRVLGLPFGQVNKVAELIPNNPGRSGDLAAGDRPASRVCRRCATEDEGIARLLEIALQIEGLYRHASTHAAGVVIGDRPLIELVPLYRDPRSDFLVTQYSMKYVEQAGLVKFDFLGLTTLTILKRAESLLRGLGIAVDVNHLPLDDQKTYEMLRERRCRRRVPDGRPGRARHAAPDAPGPVRGPGRRGRAVSPRADGQHPRILPAQARGHVGGAASEHPRHPGRDLRHHRLPGTGDADRADDGRLLAGRRGPAAARDGQEDPRRDGGAARHLHQGRDRARHRSGEGQGSLRPDGEVRRLWLQQIPRGTVWAARLSDRVAEGEPSRGVHRRLHEPRTRQHRPARRVARGGDTLGHPASCRPTSTARAPTSRSSAPAMAAWRSATRWPAVKKVGFAAMQALIEARGDTPFADLADFAARVDPRQLNRMQLENLVRAGAFDALEPNRARPVRRRRDDPAARAGRGGGEGKRPDRPVRRIARQHRERRCVCRRCPTGRRWSGSASKPRRSASTSPRIRSTSTPRRCAGSARRRARRSKQVRTPASRACVWPAWWRHRRSG